MKKEIRKLLCSWCLGLAFWIMPDGYFKSRFAEFMVQYLKDL